MDYRKQVHKHDCQESILYFFTPPIRNLKSLELVDGTPQGARRANQPVVVAREHGALSLLVEKFDRSQMPSAARLALILVGSSEAQRRTKIPKRDR